MTDFAEDTDAIGMSSRHGLHLFADGCFEPKSGNGGWAFVVCREGVEIAMDFGGVRKSANNAMEAMAILRATTWINTHAPDETVVIWSDSVYAVTGCNRWRHIWKTNGWKKITASSNIRSRTIADVDVWRAIDLQLSANCRITVAWCKGHAGIEGNERADALADEGRLSLPLQTRPA